jgi:hypothetical protein
MAKDVARYIYNISKEESLLKASSLHTYYLNCEKKLTEKVRERTYEIMTKIIDEEVKNGTGQKIRTIYASQLLNINSWPIEKTNGYTVGTKWIEFGCAGTTCYTSDPQFIAFLDALTFFGIKWFFIKNFESYILNVTWSHW